MVIANTNGDIVPPVAAVLSAAPKNGTSRCDRKQGFYETIYGKWLDQIAESRPSNHPCRQKPYSLYIGGSTATKTC